MFRLFERNIIRNCVVVTIKGSSLHVSIEVQETRYNRISLKTIKHDSKPVPGHSRATVRSTGASAMARRASDYLQTAVEFGLLDLHDLSHILLIYVCRDECPCAENTSLN